MHDPQVFGIVVEANRLCLERAEHDAGHGPCVAEHGVRFSRKFSCR